MESIKNRRTIRKYKQDDVPAALLNELLEESFRASTMGNMQLYSVVVTRNAEMKSRLAPAHFNQPMVTSAPVVLTFCADFNRFSKSCEQRKAVPGYNNFISFLNAATDALLVTQNFCTLAEEAGLGICYLGTTIYNPDQIIDLLELPELVVPVATITVGYPDECPEQPDRLPVQGIIHEEKKEDIQINVAHNMLSISGFMNKAAVVNGENMFRQERYAGGFHHAISLPSPVSQNGVKATYRNGVLEVRMPKTTQIIEHKIDVEFD